MCRNVHWWFFGAGQVHKLYVASVSAGEGKKGVVTVGTQDTEACAETEKTGWEMPRAKPTDVLPSSPQSQLNYLWSAFTLELLSLKRVSEKGIRADTTPTLVTVYTWEHLLNNLRVNTFIRCPSFIIPAEKTTKNYKT